MAAQSFLSSALSASSLLSQSPHRCPAKSRAEVPHHRLVPSVKHLSRPAAAQASSCCLGATPPQLADVKHPPSWLLLSNCPGASPSPANFLGEPAANLGGALACRHRTSLDSPIVADIRFGAVVEAKKGNPPIMPAVLTPGGPLDLSSVLFCNRIIFIGQPINSQVAQRVISQLVTLATIDEDADILMYLNCPGGSTYSVLAIYDCMSWIKPKVGTVCFGVAASQGALLLAGGEKGMRYAMPNARIMIHQPQSGCGGHVEDVRRQVNEAVQSRHKIDKMYAAFTGQPLEKVQQYTERDRFFSSSEALEFGLIDGVLETEY